MLIILFINVLIHVLTINMLIWLLEQVMVDNVYMYVQQDIFQIQILQDVKHLALMDYLLKLLIILVNKLVHMINLWIKLIINV